MFLHNPCKRGVLMKNFIIISLLIGLLISSAVGQESAIIPIKKIRNRSLLTIKVGNLVIPDILLDTGFAFDGVLIYNPVYNDSLNFPNAMEVKVPGAGRGEPARAMMVDQVEFSIGNLKMTNQRLLVMLDDLYKGFPSNGIVGYSVFGHYVTEFNYNNNTLTLHASGTIDIDPGWAVIPIYFKHNKIPWIDVSVVIDKEEPVLLSTYIDFAAGEVIELLEKEDMKFLQPDKTVDVYLGRGLSGDIYGKQGMITKVKIGPYELKNVKAAIAPAKVRSKQKNADAIIGSGCLSRFNLIFDYADKKLYIKPNGHFNEPFD
jgi:hypothetical protein